MNEKRGFVTMRFGGHRRRLLCLSWALLVWIPLAISGVSLGVPPCDTIDDGVCYTPPGQGCASPTVRWLSCEELGDTDLWTFYCFWEDGECYSELAYCWGDCGDPPSGGGGGGCFLKGTPVTMGDGTTRPIEAIKEGDTVLAYDASGSSLLPSRVMHVHPPRVVDSFLVINGVMRVSRTQPVLAGRSWVEAGRVKVGDVLTLPDGGSRVVFSVQEIRGAVTVYNLAVEAGTYIAEGVVVHNKHLPYTLEPCMNCGPY